ncbi:MAG: alanine--tRNA ligase [Phycisphaerae bacterium]|nr:alanine--tRNA ligase [Phycisphaerae bacterium]
MNKSCNQIRNDFLEFFEQRGHGLVQSSSLLPADDPTLLFTNAGMNQFKPLFLGTEKRDYTRAVDTQKCIRAGGKHNDLEDVGRDCYHHTFFEMLGNWSFGDYFKHDAIKWAWELFTDVWGLPKDRLYVTVFGGDKSENLEPDTDAENVWKEATDIDPSHISHGSKKDNFWEMGETGPCGPCSEIHIDMTPDASGADKVNADDPLVIELWNLVFIQFNRLGDGSLEPLPAQHVDTGLGLERICKVLHGKKSNYATDLFLPIIKKVEELSGKQYGVRCAGGGEDPYDTMDENDLVDVAMRVIADHARTLTFAIADGILPSNDGRGSVLRSILRRAAGFGRQHLGIEAMFIHQLVDTIVENFAGVFPELKDRQKVVIDVITDEEESFAKTLDRGLEQLKCIEAEALRSAKGIEMFSVNSFGGREGDEEKAVNQGRIIPNTQILILDKTSKDIEYKRKIYPSEIDSKLVRSICSTPPEITGERIFELHATHGFPFSLTKLIAEKDGFAVDESAFQQEMEKHRQASSAGAGKFQVEQVVGLPETDDTEKYDGTFTDATVLGWVVDGKFVSEGELPEGSTVAVILDKTSFYGESGGQVGDAGTLITTDGSGMVFEVHDTQLAGGSVLHVGELLNGTLTVGLQVSAEVHTLRRTDIMRNHSATHLLNWGLQRVLGDGVTQAGSVVDPDRLRFDFTYSKALTNDQLDEVQRCVNDRILAGHPVFWLTVPLADAKKIPGVQAMFGEKYPDPVRVVSMGTEDLFGAENNDFNFEFCGGTHVDQVNKIGLFKIVSEESIAKGVRRITAVTGRQAVAWAYQSAAVLREASGALRVPVAEIPARITAMQDEIKKLRKAPKSQGAGDLQDAVTLETPAGKVLVASSGHPDPNTMRNICDQQRQKGAVAIFLGGADDSKVTLVAMVCDELAKTGKIKAGDWVKQIAPLVGGGGGGKPTLAQAGGKQPDKLPDALAAAVEWAKQQLG